MTATCTVDTCEAKVYARQLCGRHYKQQLRHGLVQPDPVPAACAVIECGRRAVTRGWCHGHYLRWSRTGDVKADKPLARPVRDQCSVDDCERGAHSAGMCRAHARRQRLYGDPLAGRPARAFTGEGWFSHGYWCVQVPPELLHLTGGARHIGEHRLVMAQLLGRPLFPDEVVHHRNGDRTDNRAGNLELWSTAQPKGQRVEDKLAFAYELLLRYDGEVAAALGLDLDPETGYPREEPAA